MSLPRTSKDLNSCLSSLLTPKFWQKHQFLSYSISNSFQRIPIKKSSQKVPPKKFLGKNSSKKFLQNNSPKNHKNFEKKSQKISKVLKISNSLHRTWNLCNLFSLQITFWWYLFIYLFSSMRSMWRALILKNPHLHLFITWNKLSAMLVVQ